MNLSSWYKLQSQHASCLASDNAIYSASVDDKAIVVSFLDHHVIAPPPTIKTYPDTDL